MARELLVGEALLLGALAGGIVRTAAVGGVGLVILLAMSAVVVGIAQQTLP